MVEKDLSFITDAMIEASGALHVAVTDQNLVINIINKLDVAICKARTLERSRLMSLTEALDYSKDLVAEVQAEQPPPIPQQDLGKADQSPKPYGTMGFVSGGVPMPFGTVVIGSDGQIQRYELDPSHNPFDASDTPTRIVRPVA